MGKSRLKNKNSKWYWKKYGEIPMSWILTSDPWKKNIILKDLEKNIQPA